MYSGSITILKKKTIIGMGIKYFRNTIMVMEPGNLDLMSVTPNIGMCGTSKRREEKPIAPTKSENECSE